MNITVNLVDDHKVVTEGLSFILNGEADIEVMDIARSGSTALSQLNLRQPDVVIMDYSLDGDKEVNGLNVARKILDAYPSVKVMMLTMHNKPEIIGSCISDGVHGYMLKSEKDADFASAIRQLHIQGHYFSPSVAKYLALNLRKHDQENIHLTEREQEVLECLYKGASTKEIAEALFISHHTVDSHRKNLIQKFEAKNSVHLIYVALQKGFLKV
jgi:DNA-binding NarL/FixJ family response regulator